MNPLTEYSDHDGLPYKKESYFDFVVAEPKKYVPGSGPPLAPLSLMPRHDLDGIILDKVWMDKELRYIVGYEAQPHLKISVQSQNILEWVSPRTFEDYEMNEYEREEKEREELELPAILAKEERKRKRLEKLAREGQPKVDGRKRKRVPAEDVDGAVPKKRGRPFKSSSASQETTSPSGPGRRNQRSPEPVFTSPRASLSRPSLSQPSLAAPSRGLADMTIMDSESDEDEVDLIEAQLSREQTTKRSTSTSSEPLQGPSASSQSGTVEPKRRSSSSHPPIFPGKSAVAATSSREALSIYESLERKSHPATASSSSAIFLDRSPFKQKVPIFKPSKVSNSNKQRSPTPPRRSSRSRSKSATPHLRQPVRASPRPRAPPPPPPPDFSDDEDEDEEEDDSEYEVSEILGEEYRQQGKRNALYYLIRWVGDYENTWEPAENVGAEVIREYKSKKASTMKGQIDVGEDSDPDSLFVSEKPRNGMREGGETREDKGKGKERGVERSPMRGQVLDDEGNDSADSLFGPL